MNFNDSLSRYSEAQKMVAYSFIFCGLILLAVVVLLSILSQSWLGFKIGSLFFGVSILAGGFGYLRFSDKVQKQVELEFQSDPVGGLESEAVRMDKVVSDYPKYRVLFTGILLFFLLLILFGSSFWRGVACAPALLFFVILLIEAKSKSSIDRYANTIQELMNRRNNS